MPRFLLVSNHVSAFLIPLGKLMVRVKAQRKVWGSGFSRIEGKAPIFLQREWRGQSQMAGIRSPQCPHSPKTAVENDSPIKVCRANMNIRFRHSGLETNAVA